MKDYKNNILVIRTAELLLQTEENLKIFEMIVLNVLKFAAENTFEDEEIFELSQKIFKNNEKALFSKFSEEFFSIFNESETICSKIISFLLKQKIYDPSFCFFILQSILNTYPIIINKEVFLDLCIELCSHIEKLPDYSNLTKDLHEAIIDEGSKNLLQRINFLFLKLNRIGLDYKEILLDLKLKCSLTKDYEFFNIMSFISEFKDAPVSLSEIQYIWKKITTNEEAFLLIIKFSYHKLSLVQSSLLEIISSSPLGIPIFLKF